MIQMKKTVIIAIPIFISALFIFYFTSCKKDNSIDCCVLEEHIGEFSLMPESRNSIPYENELKIYFIDSLDNEVYFEFDEENQGLQQTSMSASKRCECNPSIWEAKNADTKSYVYIISEPQQLLNMKFLIHLSPNPFHGDDFLVADVLSISLNDATDSTSFSGLMDILVDERNLTEKYINWYEITKLDTVQIGDRIFNDVYANNNVFYNYEFGLVAFLDRQSKLWVYDRKEEIK